MSGIKKETQDQNRETEAQQNAGSFGSSMAERQRFGCLDIWLHNCKQFLSFRLPIEGKIGYIGL